MSLKIKAIAGAAAAAVLAFSTAAYAVSEGQSVSLGETEKTAEQRWAERDAEIEQRLLVEEAERADNGLTEFEEALMRGECPYDFRSYDYDTQIASGEIHRFDNTPRSADESGYYPFKLIHGIGEGYYLWSGSFRVPSVSKFVETYSTNSFDCTCDGGKSASMSSKDGYNGNFKEVTVRLTFLKDGKVNYVSDFTEGTGKNITLSDLSGNGELVGAAYYFYLHVGSAQNTPLHEVAYVNVVDDNFVETALYKESMGIK